MKEELKNLMYFSTLINEEVQEGELLKHLVQVSKEHFHPDILAVLMLDDDKKILDVPLIDPPMPANKLIKTDTFLNPSLCRVIRTGREFIVKDINRDPSCECFCYKAEEGGYMCMPLTVGGTTTGAFLIIKNEKSFWDSEENHSLLSIYTGLASSAMHKVRLMEANRRAAVTDALTGLYNRKFFDETLLKQTALAKRNKEPLGLLIIGLDRFRDFNDTYGNAAGERLLQQTAGTLRDTIRASDVPSRYGEGFAIIMPGTGMTGSLKKAHMIRRHVESISFEIEPELCVRTTISIGVASFPEHGSDDSTLTDAAESALYRAREEGGNRVEAP